MPSNSVYNIFAIVSSVSLLRLVNTCQAPLQVIMSLVYFLDVRWAYRHLGPSLNGFYFLYLIISSRVGSNVEYHPNDSSYFEPLMYLFFWFRGAVCPWLLGILNVLANELFQKRPCFIYRFESILKASRRLSKSVTSGLPGSLLVMESQPPNAIAPFFTIKGGVNSWEVTPIRWKDIIRKPKVCPTQKKHHLIRWECLIRLNAVMWRWNCVIEVIIYNAILSRYVC